MTVLEIPLSRQMTAERATELVERLAATEGLEIRLRGTLDQYPGSLCWHLARPKELGALVVTFWPAHNRLWLVVQGGQSAEWMLSSVLRLGDHVQHVPHARAS
jgi:hypothetical protein